MSNQLIVFKKFYDFVILIYPVINRIPKSHRLVLGRQIEEVCILILVQITQANKAFGSDRQNIQNELSQNLDILRILMRLTKDLNFMSIGQFMVLMEKENEISKMLYCWINS